MKSKTTIGLGLLALAAAAAWYWWKNKAATAGGKTEAAAKPYNAFGSGQIGSNFQTDVTPEIVALTLDYARKTVIDNGPCWKPLGQDTQYHPGTDIYQKSDNPDIVLYLPIGQRPLTGHVC